ncbi:hypothetical protein ACVJBD_003217 [Rhizobium mongolense]
MRKAVEIAVQRASHVASAGKNISGNWAKALTRATAKQAPTSVPARRYRLFDRLMPRLGWATIQTVIAAHFASPKSSARAM